VSEVEPSRRRRPASAAASRKHAGPRRIALLGGLHDGPETVFNNVRAEAERDPGLDPLAVPIPAYRRDRFERLLPFLPSSTRCTLRYVAGTRPLFTTPGLDAVWTHLDISLLPWMLTKNWRNSVPVIYSTDSTPRQLRAFGVHYGYWGGRSDIKFRIGDAMCRRCVRRVTAVHAFTEWAARSLRDDYGVLADRIRVLPPGVDTSFWKPAISRQEAPVPRVIFVGGDFYRKGGDLLLDVYRDRFRGRAELDIVTRPGIVEPEPGIRVHTDLTSNDPRLRRLYQEADVLVIPTRADCFSMAGLEAMSSGVPLVTCPVGGVAEVMTDGREGRFVPPDDGRALASAMESIVVDGTRRRSMGAAARELAVTRYDARVNTRRLLRLVEEVTGMVPQEGG
jgi:glycosyltransferase involved in cell wall biosynthesis